VREDAASGGNGVVVLLGSAEHPLESPVIDVASAYFAVLPWGEWSPSPPNNSKRTDGESAQIAVTSLYQLRAWILRTIVNGRPTCSASLFPIVAACVNEIVGYRLPCA
jgi:hypothetical protein